MTSDTEETCMLCGDIRAAHTKSEADWRTVPGCTSLFRKRCAAIHLDTGAQCGFPVGHEQNHRGTFAHGIAQWPHNLDGPAGGARDEAEATPVGQGAQASQSTGALQAERDRLRAALVGLVGVDGRADLEAMEAVMRLMPAPAEDKAATIDAIHALLATVPLVTAGGS